MPNLVNNLLRRLREKQFMGESLAKVAEKVGVSKTMLAKYENGQLKRPPIEVAERLLQAYDCTGSFAAAVMDLVQDIEDEASLADDDTRYMQFRRLVSAAHEFNAEWKMPVRVVANSPHAPIVDQKDVYTRYAVDMCVLLGNLMVCDPAFVEVLRAKFDVLKWFLYNPQKLPAMSPPTNQILITNLLAYNWTEDGTILRVTADESALRRVERHFEILERAALNKEKTEQFFLSVTAARDNFDMFRR